MQYVPVLSDMTDEVEQGRSEVAVQPVDQPAAVELDKLQVLGRADRRADPGVQHASTPPSPAADHDGRSRQQQSAAEQGRAVPDDPACAGVLGDLLRGAVLLAVPDVAVDLGGSIYLPDADVRLGLRQLRRGVQRSTRIRSSGSFIYALAATVLCVLLAFPLAYVIAFKAGRYKNLILGLVILPFFVTFLIRTIAWKTILADDGWVVARSARSACCPARAGCCRRAGRSSAA